MALIDYIDGPNRRIYLSADTMNTAWHPVDLYREVRALRRTDESLRKYDSFMRGDGNIDKGGGKATERYFTLLNGTRIVPYNASHIIDITGTIITDDGYEGAFCFDKSGLDYGVSVDIQYAPKQVEVINLNFDDLVYSSFQNAVWVDVNSQYSDAGSANYPNGNRERPVNNINIATQIAKDRGFDTIRLIGSVTLVTGNDVSNMQIIGSNPITSILTVEEGAVTDNLVVKECYFTGALDNGSILRDCVLGNIQYFNGYVEHCAFTSSTIYINGIGIFLNCAAGATCISDPIIDMTDALGLAVRDYQGNLNIANKTGASQCVIGINGKLTIDETCTAGGIEVYGDGYVIDNSQGAIIVDRTTGTPTEIANKVQSIIDTLRTALETLIGDPSPSLDIASKLDSLDSGLRQVLSNIADEINENQVIIENNNMKVSI